MIDTRDYEIEDEARVRDLVRNHGWATLVWVADDGAPVASHVPVQPALAAELRAELGRRSDRS